MRKGDRTSLVTAVGAILVLLAGAGAALSQAYDPYGPKPKSNGPSPRDIRAVTPFIGMFDGTPRYELHPTPYARSDAGESGLLAFNHQDYLPLDFGRGALELVTPEGREPMPYHYLVKYWETYPNAREREGRVPHLGIVNRDILVDDRNPPPPAIKAVLDRQARAMYDAVLAHPFIQRSEGGYVSARQDYHHDADPSGTRVWGFRLHISMPGIARGTGRQRADGRWENVKFTRGGYITICSNCFDRVHTTEGRYRGLQYDAPDRILVDTIEKPLWISRYRGGQGEQITDPQLYDASRPETEIQLLTVNFWFHVGQATEAPDTAKGRSVAAAWLTDWKGLVDQLNGPDAPRAD